MKRLGSWLLFLVFIVAIIGLIIRLKPKPLIPSDIKQSVASTIFVFNNSPQTVNQKGTVKYDSKLNLLSYEATIYGVNSTISEQPAPENFTDVPQVYQKVLDSWNQYGSFDSSLGTVYLTKPKNNGNKEVGVMNSQGTLMFVKADKNLTNDQWKKAFNNLSIVK